MTFCQDCKYYDSGSSCTAPQNKKGVKMSTVERGTVVQDYRWLSYVVPRSFWWGLRRVVSRVRTSSTLVPAAGVRSVILHKEHLQ